MANQIIDKDGLYFKNTGSFPFQDPTTGARFEPSAVVKVKQSEWMKGQPVLKQVDENGEDLPAVAQKTK